MRRTARQCPPEKTHFFPQAAAQSRRKHSFLTANPVLCQAADKAQNLFPRNPAGALVSETDRQHLFPFSFRSLTRSASVFILSLDKFRTAVWPGNRTPATREQAELFYIQANGIAQAFLRRMQNRTWPSTAHKRQKTPPGALVCFCKSLALFPIYVSGRKTPPSLKCSSCLLQRRFSRQMQSDSMLLPF